MARQVNHALWDQWRQRLERQRTSGLPIVAFCKKEGVSPAAFHAWKGKLHAPVSARRPGQKASVARRFPKQAAANSPRHKTQPASSQAPVADFVRLPIRGTHSSPWIELSLVDGTLVRVPQENLAALTTLLRVLRGDGPELILGEARRA